MWFGVEAGRLPRDVVDISVEAARLSVVLAAGGQVNRMTEKGERLWRAEATRRTHERAGAEISGLEML